MAAAGDAPQWAFMHAWWSELTGMPDMHLQFKPRAGSLQFGFRSFELYPPLNDFEADRRRWIRHRDALELVLLLRTVDEHAFKAMTRKFCPDEEGAEVVWSDIHPEEAIPKLMEVRFDAQQINGEDDSWATTLLTALLEPVMLRGRSKRFRESRDKMLTMASDSVRREIQDNQWTIPVKIGILAHSEKATTAILKHIAKLKQSMDTAMQTARQQKEEKRRAKLRGYAFRASTVSVTLIGVKEPAILCGGLDEIAATKGLELQDIHYRDLGGSLPKRSLGDLVDKLTRAPSSSDSVETEASLLIDRPGSQRPVSAVTVAQFLSAVPVSRFQSVGLSSVFSDLTQSDRQYVWRWIAYAFFSPMANRKIPTCELSMSSMTEDDVATVRAFIEAKNPTALLCHPTWRLRDAYDSETQPRKRVALTQGASIFLNTSRTRRAESMPLSYTGRFDVIQENHGFVDVVVPAYGQCRVRKADVTEWEELPDIGSRAASTNHPIKSLKIVKVSHPFSVTIAPDDSANVASFLELVGQALESLDVYYPAERSDVLLDAVWAACPNLKTLRFGLTSVPSLQYFVDAYETGRCRVPSLDLTECTVEDPTSRSSFFEALKGPEPRTKIASVLREFSFSEDPKGNYPFLTFDEVTKIGDSLNSNQTLRYVCLGILGTLGVVEERNLGFAFDTLDGQILWGVGKPLPIRHKCALLSIVQHANDILLIPAARQIAQLDSGVLSDILAFAAEPVRRSVALKHH